MTETNLEILDSVQWVDMPSSGSDYIEFRHRKARLGIELINKNLTPPSFSPASCGIFESFHRWALYFLLLLLCILIQGLCKLLLSKWH